MAASVKLIGISRHRFSTDGDGVTTLVAFYGCTLRCKYCLNPQCLNSNGDWKKYSCDELYEEVKKDALYFLATSGGITFGGGEPCLQSEFICQFRELCGWEWQLTIETALNVERKHLERLLPVINKYYVDIKDLDEKRYFNYTGKSNKIVINNLRWLVEQGKAEKVVVRVPVIPLYNATADVEHNVVRLKEMGLMHIDKLVYRT